jgi:hypothetical protein
MIWLVIEPLGVDRADGIPPLLKGAYQPRLLPPGALQDHPLDLELAPLRGQGLGRLVAARDPFLSPRRVEVNVQGVLADVATDSTGRGPGASSRLRPCDAGADADILGSPISLASPRPQAARSHRTNRPGMEHEPEEGSRTGFGLGHGSRP